MVMNVHGFVVISLLILASLILTRAHQIYNHPEQFDEKIPNLNPIVADNEVVLQYNASNDVWNHHPIEDSLPLDYDIKYPTAYYNELNNTQFLEALNKTFQPNQLLLNGEDWTAEIVVDKQHIPPKEVQDGYKKLIPWIQDMLNVKGRPFFKLVGDETAPFQVIHNHWNSWSKFLYMPNKFLYNIDVLLYREAKYHAKHVRFQIILQDQKLIHIASIKIIGIVLEDKFGLFPVIQSDKTDLEQPQMDFNPNPLVNYAPLIREKEIQEEIHRRKIQQERYNKIMKIFEKQPPN